MWSDDGGWKSLVVRKGCVGFLKRGGLVRLQHKLLNKRGCVRLLGLGCCHAQECFCSECNQEFLLKRMDVRMMKMSRVQELLNAVTAASSTQASSGQYVYFVPPPLSRDEKFQGMKTFKG